MFTKLEFTEDVCCIVAKIADLAGYPFDPLEDACIPLAIDKRRIEFHAGRRIARIAMSELGVESSTIPVGTNREPVWPSPVTGSISHNQTYVGIAMAKSSDYQSIGFDLENHHSVTDAMRKHVLTPDELDTILDKALDPTFYFSSKEAVFKAVFPIHREFFSFTDVHIRAQGARFTARSCNKRLNFAPTIERGLGKTRLCENYLANLFLIPN